jgi:regulation of enolase protein 1 (concanavalin A-like superfamily)
VEWINQPAQWSEAGGVLTVLAETGTDFWRTTHYGFIRNNGHVYGAEMHGNFDMSLRFRGRYTEQYDQAGAMVRVDEKHWLKTGIEYVDGRKRFSIVATLEYSSWFVADLPADAAELSLLLVRRGDSVEISYGVDEGEKQLAGVVYLPPGQAAFAGAMCAAPDGGGFEVTFHDLVITPVA